MALLPLPVRTRFELSTVRRPRFAFCGAPLLVARVTRHSLVVCWSNFRLRFVCHSYVLEKDRFGWIAWIARIPRIARIARIEKNRKNRPGTRRRRTCRNHHDRKGLMHGPRRRHW